MFVGGLSLWKDIVDAVRLYGVSEAWSAEP